MRIEESGIRGFLHEAEGELSIVLSHGAGSDSRSKLMVGMAEAFAAARVRALRLDLPFRVARPLGPPHPSVAERDRNGIRAAVAWLGGRVLIGGHSYGGRQSSMVAAEDPALAEGLLLLSYPLHPPRKPDQMRTAHFPALRTPALFVHGTRDPFGTPDELRAALPSAAELMLFEGSGHELKGAVKDPRSVVTRFLSFLKASVSPVPG
jgi:predicted alpha/beta-hydrolase family hydrolase